MKNQLNPSSVRMTKKFDQQLYEILASELKTVKISKNQLMTRLTIPRNGMVE